MVKSKSLPFCFKQFAVAQDECAMKVNTDAVLLGAWADVNGAKRILDIGTGTGIIALIVAQKSNRDRNVLPCIDAIDIDKSAFLQAKGNFERSKWSNRLNAIHSSLQDFVAEKKYDIIISNPPYFIDDFKSKNTKKNIAKHSVTLTYETLLSCTNNLLTQIGKFFLVVPFFNYSVVEFLAAQNGLFVAKLVTVIAVQGKVPYLCLIQFQRRQYEIVRDSIVIQTELGGFTTDYKQVTKEFYLKF